ncbi:MAG TPA: cobalamin biosynthesis protein CbiN [Methanothermobacter sp.]|jgi:cobalt/nickel transport protein|uniref:Cobalt transporter CbiN n=1 Tax=Methanothermobacter tenebrarum TaxID=680118 RepID=A0ABM7YFI8_9EURY|nr:PDGLE domain-containing protein [Methanothermobacter tenebrarum]MDD3454648.1 PDGLE domain-containing protein [Methanobacteriales archaeon]MDI6882189.1 PDGLE domain-containing protein [Methanothermobacter sp.]MDX9692743.1 PDGLE domain-containing protein [Methanothermobacter sp.]BDH80114.1 cobalt transporter CbiN [Methanothermobacter tenebrarum]HHW15927.1 cobalamin biosynthesis protein CbiN [Methanothermobacter sp.]
MKSRDKKLLIGGVIIALIIAALAPFLASSNPDGLESTAEKVMPNPETEPFIESPLPDYTIPGLGKEGEILALVVGTIIVLIIAYGISAALKAGK